MLGHVIYSNVQIISLIFSSCVPVKHILISPDLKSVNHETTHIILPSEKTLMNESFQGKHKIILIKDSILEIM